MVTREEFLKWHEEVIANYPEDIKLELRRSRDKFIVRWK